MIGSFKDEETRRLAAGERTRKVPSEVRNRAQMRLARIAASERIDDLRVPPSHRLERLQGGSPRAVAHLLRMARRGCLEC